ncbi:MAG: 2Fe-2S iron-sulfur cluster binding domain-containing protein [Polyangiales bacterium]
MPTLTWQGRALALDAGETVLDVLDRAGERVASSCRVGACQSCLVRARGGAPPAGAQKGLRPALAEQGYFLACQARPDNDLEAAPADDLPRVRAAVVRVERPAADVARIFLAPEAPFAYRAGQFVHVARADGLTRPYSLAGVPDDAHLELHVRRAPGGAMSGYLCDALAPGDVLTLRGPAGSCCYENGRPSQPLVLAGTGTGLAPLLGVARDALARGHEGPITLLHGAVTAAGLYADDVLTALAARHPTLRYAPSVLDAPPGDPRGGAIRERLGRALREAPGARVFLCGPPETVGPMQRDAFLGGVKLRDLLVDAFVTAPPAR